MTRSRLADHAFWASVLGVLAASACGGRSLSIGGDPLELAVGASAGTFTSAGTGGVGATSGTTGGTGGTVSLPTGGTGGAVIVVGGMGGAGDNAYPPVSWQNGQGYRDVCAEHDDTSGFTCWHFGAGTGSTCALDGSPECNACSCAIPCDEASDCPLGPLEEPAGCLGADTNVRSCFLTCDDGECPLGMECSTYPGESLRVCMWISPSSGMGTPK